MLPIEIILTASAFKKMSHILSMPKLSKLFPWPFTEKLIKA